MKRKFCFFMASLMLLTSCGATANEIESERIDYAVDIDRNETKAEESFDGGLDTAEAYESEGEFLPPQNYPQENNEEYTPIEENFVIDTLEQAVSTFSVDVDTASYTNSRRFIESGDLPPKDAVRIEEFINYFNYDYDKPLTDPIGINAEVTPCPWDNEKLLMSIGLQAKDVDKDELSGTNIVLLVDVSGSMEDPDKLPLLREAFKILTDELSENDRVSLVTYASGVNVLLDSVKGSDKDLIKKTLGNLTAGGSTAGSAALETAYNLASENFIKGGNNRIIIATDGDFNVGISSVDELYNFVSEKSKSGVDLSVLGFGTGNIKDNIMETLADNGNGNYYYIDSLKEAYKVLTEEFMGTIYTVAKDVKIQVEFNPAVVKDYKLVGYENRALENRDFTDDKKDAGDIGSNHQVTALYEISPANDENLSGDGSMIYQTSILTDSRDFATVNVRYKNPGEDESRLLQKTVDESLYSEKMSENLEFAASVAEFALLLREGEAFSDFSNVLNHAKKSRGDDKDGYRQGFIELVETAGRIL